MYLQISGCDTHTHTHTHTYTHKTITVPAARMRMAAGSQNLLYPDHQVEQHSFVHS